MSDAPDDGPYVELEGVRYEFIPYGSETNDDGVDWFQLPCNLCRAAPGELHDPRCRLGAGSTHERPAECRDCGVPIGRLHVGGCVIDQCPRCGGQFMSCECNETLDGVEVVFPDEEDE